MPLNYSYPGVYVEEVPSGVRTITGVSTSITAFIGRAVRGEVGTPILISSYAGFERTFGGLHVDYPMSYAVKDFFLNGGSKALIVRLYKPKQAGQSENDCCAVFNLDNIVVERAEGNGGAESADSISATSTEVPPSGDDVTGNIEHDEVEDSTESNGDTSSAVETSGDAPDNLPETDATDPPVSQPPADGDVTPDSGASDETQPTRELRASSPGTWGNRLYVKIDYKGLEKKEDVQQVLQRYHLSEDQIDLDRDLYFFNLTVSENPPYGPQEGFHNITLHEEGGSRRIDRVLSQGSNLVHWKAGENTYSLEPEGAIRPQRTDSEKDPTSPDNKPIDRSFNNGEDSQYLLAADDFTGQKSRKTGMYALEKADLFNLLCIPPDNRNEDTLLEVYQNAMNYCVDRRAMLIVDPPKAWKKAEGTMPDLSDLTSLGLTGPAARNAAVYFPRVIQSDPLRENQLDTLVPCGIMAGLMAQTDSLRGVWKAPAGTDAALQGVKGLEVNINDAENGQLNPLGINCLRSFPLYGHVAWGARTLRGADQMADEYKYIPVRRLALYIEESLYRGLKWVVFEPNDEPLWRQIRTNVKVFMADLSKLGAFQGYIPDERYLVKCDSEINTQSDINKGIVNILVSFAPLKPAEFVVIRLQQLAGQLIGA